MKLQGFVVIAVACLAPLIWLPAIGAGKDLSALFSQYIGLVALITMALAQIIATRWPGIEATFGPLDQCYRLHKWLGMGGLVTVLIHDTIDADMRELGQASGLNDAAETAGEISLYLLLILVLISVATFIPYRLWKWTHRIIGLCFVLGAVHYLFILKPFQNGDPLGLYMIVICGLGTLAYLYTLAPRTLRPSRPYRITEIHQDGSALSVDMAPEGRAMTYRAGQFGFLTFEGAGLHEPHPFTIASAPRPDGSLRVTIAPLGDLTCRLSAALDKEQAVRVEGGYGEFGTHVPGAQVWVAAGVGITPFVALAEALEPTAPAVHLIYCIRGAATAAHLATLEVVARDKPNLTLTLWDSSTDRRLGPDQIAALVPDISARTVLFCGPAPMRRALSKGLAAHGVGPRSFRYEEFEMRTGVGLRRLADWLWTRKKS